MTPKKGKGPVSCQSVSIQFSVKNSKSRVAGPDVDVEKGNKFFRKISKYDIDRGIVDFAALKRERQRETAEANLLKKQIMEK